jgi:tryptophan 2,3-dioxygenase
MTATPASMTYADYLALGELLGAQRPISDHHDELLFIIIHQTKELWLKQMLHEVDLACELVRGGHFAGAHKALSRVSRIQTVMTLSWDILSTLTPFDYMQFRGVLGSSSGFQSVQFRLLEFRLGLKDEKFLKFGEGGAEGRARLEAALAQPSLREEANAALGRAGFDISTPEAIEQGWLAVYRDAEKWFDLYGLAEKLVDVDDALVAWRMKHVLTVERIIGMKRGTGGSEGAAYLKTTLDKRAFPQLWSIRTSI